MSKAPSAAKVDALVQLIAGSVETSPHELYGYNWCKMSHHDRAAALGISERTLRRMVGAPPGKAPFVSTCRVINGTKTILLRVGDYGPPTPEDEARKMVSIWRAWLQKHVPAHRATLEYERKTLQAALQQGSVDEKEAKGRIKAIDKTIGRLRLKETGPEYGCMVGLAKEWPTGLQVELFKMVINDWMEFMAGVKVVQAQEAGLGTVKPMYFEYPHIKTLRRYCKVAVEMMVMRFQKNGKEPPAALKAVNPGLWKHLAPN
jgi:hypothetical protein